MSGRWKSLLLGAAALGVLAAPVSSAPMTANAGPHGERFPGLERGVADLVSQRGVAIARFAQIFEL